MHVSTLLVEQAKLGIQNKSETQASRNERQIYLIDQAINVQKWIEDYYNG